MWIVLTVLGVIAVLVAVVGLTRSAAEPQTAAPETERNAAAPDPGDAAMFPRPGEASPHTATGEPVPGSRDDRHRHGRT